MNQQEHGSTGKAHRLRKKSRSLCSEKQQASWTQRLGSTGKSDRVATLIQSGSSSRKREARWRFCGYPCSAMSV